MKTINKYIYIVLGILFLSLNSCEDKLAITPTQSLAEAVAFSSLAAAEASLNGVYSQMQDNNAFGSQPQIIGDYMADNTFFVGSFPTLQDINNYVTTSPNGSIQGWWEQAYRVINSANTVVDRAPGIKDPLATADKLNVIVANAKFLRAVTYFHLVNLFGQPFNQGNGSALGVPIVLKGFTGEIEYPARATVALVHDQIKKDLTEALAALPATAPGNSLRGRATKGAAAGYLSRLHLYRGEYQLAADFAKQVIDDAASYKLAINQTFYTAVGTEDVFTLFNSATDNGRTGAGGWASYHRPASAGGRGDCPFTDDLVATFEKEAGDLRFTALSDVVTTADNSKRRMTLKFPDAATNADKSPMLRMGEIHLTRAEALAELNGVNQTSIDLVNPIRVRAGLTQWTIAQFATKQDLINAILLERRKELCFEGHRRMDLLRRGLPLRTTGTTASKAKFGDPYTILPIPQREIDLNSQLKQNTGW